MRAFLFGLPTAIFSAAVLFGAVAQSADAATVTLGLISRQIAPGNAAGEWELWAWTSAGDNDGIAAYDIDIAGDDLFAEHIPPVIVDLATFTLSGFIVDGFGIPECGCSALFAAQGPHPGGQLFGVGSPDVPERIPPTPFTPEFSTNAEWWMNEAFVTSPTFPEYPVAGDNPFQVPAGAVQLAYGTISRFDRFGFGVEANVSVWEVGGSTRALDADVVQFVDHVSAVPEPRSCSNACILLVGIFATLLHSRRRLE